MAVRKLESGLWVADVTLGKRLDGTRDRRQPQFKTKAEAKKEERRLNVLKEIRRGKSYGGILFRDFVEDYFWPQKEDLRPTTKRGYKRDLKLRLLPAFGAMPVEDIDRCAIQKMISSCPTKKVATNAKETLSSVLGLALEMGLIQVNPAGFRNYRYPPATRTDPEAMGEWLRCFKDIYKFVAWVHEVAPDSPEERMAVLGLLEGMRKGEVLGLDGPGVHLSRRYVDVYQSYTQGDEGPELTDPKTPAAFRHIPVSKVAYGYMSQWDLDEGPVVCGRWGKRMRPTTARDRMAALVRGAKYPDGAPVPRLTQFSMRHSFGTSAAAAGMDRLKLRDWMGHVDESVTARYYIKYTEDDLRSEADIMDELFDDAA